MAKFPARLPRSRLEKLRSREQSQPALSYIHIENFTKYLEVGRDLGNRDSPRVNWSNVKRPIDRRHQDWGTSKKSAERHRKAQFVAISNEKNQYCEKVRKVFYYAVGRINESRTISMRENKHSHWFIISPSFFHRKICLFFWKKSWIKTKIRFYQLSWNSHNKGCWRSVVREGFLRKIACVAAGPRIV